MKKIIFFFSLIGLLMCLVCPGESKAQIVNRPPGAFVIQSGPQYRWCSGPHRFQVDVKATVHHWLFAYLQATRIHYDVYKPGNYRVRKKLIAISNEPISVTIGGVQNLVHMQNPQFPPVYHWAALSPDPPTVDEIVAMTDPLLADTVGEDGTVIPNWTEPEELFADPDWAPGTRMPDALYRELGLETLVGEEPKNPDTPGIAPVLEATAGLDVPGDLLPEDTLLLERAPLQFNEQPIRTVAGDPFIMRKWLYDGICVGFWNRSCNYEDPSGYMITVTANPVYPH
jgi:hypothetical protein